MIKKIEKEIRRLELLKEQKTVKRNQFDEEISEASTQLKELYSLKNQYEKLQNSQFLWKEWEHPKIFLRW